MKENLYLDDGAYSAVRCVIELVRTAKEGGGRDVTALLADLKEPAESREYRLKVLNLPYNICIPIRKQLMAAAVTLRRCWPTSRSPSRAAPQGALFGSQKVV